MASSSGDRCQRASSAAVEDLKPFIEINKDDRGIPEVLLVSPRGAAVRVSLHGGQVRSWRNEKGEELLFTSSKAIYKPPAAVRGGIPICFPQFGNRGSLEQHGFARNRMWVVDENPPPIQSFDSSCRTFIDLLLKSSDEDLKHWPHSFELRLRVLLTFEGHLILISRVRNVNCKPFSFSFSFHTYFSVSDISEVRVEGLETLDYLDNLRNRERFTEQGDALTFESEAIYKPPAAVRGGIPICFPQFGNRGSLEQHGFARNRMWVVDENPPPIQSFDSSCRTFIDLLLKSSDEDLKHWPHSFELRLRVLLTFEGHLILISRVRNVNCKPFSFSFSFHTYFSVSDISITVIKLQLTVNSIISEVRVEGLETLDYLDNLRNRERFTEQGDALTFESEVDRAYLSSSDAVSVFDHEKKRTFVIKKEGLPDVVVWNPWDKRAKAIPDFGDDEYRRMLCVDAACIEKQNSSEARRGMDGTSRAICRALDNMMMHDKAKGFQVKEQAETNMTNSILLHPEVALFLCHLNNNNTQWIIKSHFAVVCENGCYILIAMILVFVLNDSWNWYMILNSAKVLNLNCEVV
ncbi:UNVERIFIED_CONTAM: putative glucose-6-phosphate 1-epimerase [Sesamum angustifolium]|uniref:glucose-6-phosphate 1-epimerase n=1 Tax=Sesamum angustifolium TaxID=2727405 RepID=A0AAW2MIK2_9LAMI